MDTIAEALRYLYNSEQLRPSQADSHVIRAQVLATLALAEQVEKLTEKLPDKELSNAKRVTITFNDDTTQDQIDTLCQAIALMTDQLMITAVIIFEHGEKKDV